MNCWLEFNAIEALGGDTEIESNTAGLTVTVAVPEMLAELAEIVAGPVMRPVARPAEDMFAISVSDDVHVTELVRSCVVPSVKVPDADSCSVVPSASREFAGETVNEVNVAVTDNIVPPLNDPEVAVINEDPLPALVAKPCVPAALLIVAIVGFEEVH